MADEDPGKTTASKATKGGRKQTHAGPSSRAPKSEEEINATSTCPETTETGKKGTLAGPSAPRAPRSDEEPNAALTSSKETENGKKETHARKPSPEHCKFAKDETDVAPTSPDTTEYGKDGHAAPTSLEAPKSTAEDKHVSISWDCIQYWFLHNTWDSSPIGIMHWQTRMKIHPYFNCLWVSYCLSPPVWGFGGRSHKQPISCPLHGHLI